MVNGDHHDCGALFVLLSLSSSLFYIHLSLNNSYFFSLSLLFLLLLTYVVTKDVGRV
jgi:hypothetical protein